MTAQQPPQGYFAPRSDAVAPVKSTARYDPPDNLQADQEVEGKDRGKAKELWLRAKQLLENADPLRRDDQKLKDIDQKLKTLESGNR